MRPKSENSRVPSREANPDFIDPRAYLQEKKIYKQRRDEFMIKYLRRTWPNRFVFVLGIFQLLISLAILAVDFPIIFMYAPRWQLFAGCWTFVLGFIACVSTLHSTKKMTWLKLRIATLLNAIAGIAACVMIGFDILYLTNPYICVIISGCNYLSYTYTSATALYAGEVFVGLLLFITVFIFLFLFMKYGCGGTTLFETIQAGRTTATVMNPMLSAQGPRPVPTTPKAGPGVARGKPPPPPLNTMPGYRPPPSAASQSHPPSTPGVPQYPPQTPTMQRYRVPAPPMMQPYQPAPPMMQSYRPAPPMMQSYQPAPPMMQSYPPPPAQSGMMQQYPPPGAGAMMYPNGYNPMMAPGTNSRMPVGYGPPPPAGNHPYR